MSKKPFNQLKTQAARDKRIAANNERQLQIIADAGLENPVIMHGYIAAFMVKNTLMSQNGKPGKHYKMNLYADGEDHFFDIYTYSDGYIKYFDNIVALKEADKQSGARKLTGTVLAGTNPKSKSKRLNVATVFVDNNKR